MIIWIKSTKQLVKLVPGTGDNLDKEDIDNGMVDYLMYDVYDVVDDEVTEPDGGMLMSKTNLDADSALELVYSAVVPGPYNKDDIIVLEDSYGD